MKTTAVKAIIAESRDGMRQAEQLFQQRARERSVTNRLSLVASNTAPKTPFQSAWGAQDMSGLVSQKRSSGL